MNKVNANRARGLLLQEENVFVDGVAVPRKIVNMDVNEAKGGEKYLVRSGRSPTPRDKRNLRLVAQMQWIHCFGR